MDPSLVGWLRSWLGQTSYVFVTEELTKQLEPYRPSEPVYLYRGETQLSISTYHPVSDGQEDYPLSNHFYRHYTSWFYSEDTARYHSPTVIASLIKPEQILFDTTFLPAYIAAPYRSSGAEVIVKPGVIDYRVVPG